eukprot:scaffold2134_cov93-Cylindrotheca_fusiformis.AAC.15
MSFPDFDFSMNTMGMRQGSYDFPPISGSKPSSDGMSLFAASSFKWVQERNENPLEPIPIHASRTESAAIQAALADTIKVLFDDQDNFEPPQDVLSEESSLFPTTGKRTQEMLLDEVISSEEPSAKRRHPSSELDEYLTLRFRPFQADQWDLKFDELKNFREKEGHCNVPHTYPENPPLARWVKRQRYQYKLKMEGKPSTMTDRRMNALGKLGFVWDAHNMAWENRLKDLQQYRREHGDCNVPTKCEKNRQLGVWVKCQRRQYKLFQQGKTSTMTAERVAKLNDIGFLWAVSRFLIGGRYCLLELSSNLSSYRVCSSKFVEAKIEGANVVDIVPPLMRGHDDCEKGGHR